MKIEDLTLKQLAEHCANAKCKDCIFSNNICDLDGSIRAVRDGLSGVASKKILINSHGVCEEFKEDKK